jgi:polyisoprenoid-binding protein YceI
MLLLPAFATAAPLVFGSTDGTIGFRAHASLHDFEGSASNFMGDFDPETLVGHLKVAASSLTTGLGPRDERLRLYCMEAEKYPSIEMNVQTVTGAMGPLKAGSGSGTLQMTGELVVRDVHQSITVPVSYTWENGALRMKGEWVMRWSLWGIPDPSLVISTLDPVVTVQFNVVAKPTE